MSARDATDNPRLAVPVGARAPEHPLWQWTRGVRGWLTLIVICLTVYLPGLTSIAPIDRDESRFAQASRQMFESVALPKELRDPAMHSGGLAVPMVQDRPRLNKPPLVYWLQAAAAAVFTGGDPLKDAIWMYRVPGVLCAIASVLITWRLGRRMFDPRAAWLGAVILGVCPLVVVDAHMARADQLLLTTVVAGQYWLWRAWRSRSGRVAEWQSGRVKGTKRITLPLDHFVTLPLWLCIGASILAKGPIGPMVIGLTALMIAAVHGRAGLRWLWSLRPITGVVIVLAMCLPWLWMVGEHVGWQKYYDTIFKETITRSLEPKEGHWGPPGYHLLLMVALLWPGSMLTGVGVVRAVRVGWPRVVEKGQAASRWWKRRGGRDAELFCIAWIAPAWIVFELVSTKLPHYTMPMYPALALLSARAVMSAAKLLKNDKVARFGAMACVWAGPAIAALSCACLTILLFAGLAEAIGLFFAIAFAGVVGWQAAYATIRTAWVRAQVLGLATSAVLVASVFAIVLPTFMPGALTRDVIEMMNSDAPNWPARPIATLYHEDSMIFATRGRAQRINESDAPQWFRDHPHGLLVAPRQVKAPMEVAVEAARGPQMREIGILPQDMLFAGRPWFYLYEVEWPK